MSALPESVDFELEHVLGELWALDELDPGEPEPIHRRGQVRDFDDALRRLVDAGWALDDGRRVSLTDSGRELAARVIRRHRLAELLLSTILEVGDDRAVDRTACVMEHVLTATVTDSVCAFLGHPKFCPHGKPIPPGRCCRSFSETVEPLVQPLERVPVGTMARVVYVAAKDPARLARLSGLGLAPGAQIRLQQTHPATVVHVGETTLALDREMAAQIYVKIVD